MVRADQIGQPFFYGIAKRLLNANLLSDAHLIGIKPRIERLNLLCSRSVLNCQMRNGFSAQHSVIDRLLCWYTMLLTTTWLNTNLLTNPHLVRVNAWVKLQNLLGCCIVLNRQMRNGLTRLHHVSLHRLRRTFIRSCSL